MIIPNPVFFYQLYFFISKPKIRHLIKQVEVSTSAWPYISAKTHALGGREFDLNNKEIAHIHWNGDLDILFNQNLVKELINQNLAKQHTFVPGKAITYAIKKDSDVRPAVNLIRLAYLVHARKAAQQDDKLLKVIDIEILELPYNHNILELAF